MHVASNRLLRFYIGSHPDNRGRMLAEILSQDDVWLERTHDYIQWLFPLADVSGANPDAPLVDGPTKEAFRHDEQLRLHLLASLQRMLRFLGLGMSPTGTIGKAGNWSSRKVEWFTFDTHNSLRITRMIKSLALLGLDPEAQELRQVVLHLCAQEPDCGISDTTRRFWEQSIG